VRRPSKARESRTLLRFKDPLVWETGYSLNTLRQASRGSWRIGQTEEVTVKYFAYPRTAQETSLRLRGSKREP